MKVLVVDDDPMVLDLVVHFLGIATHHNVNAAPSATAALEAISDADDPYDCFLCDIRMPDVDGISLVRLIRQTPDHTDTPIIMLTAADEKKDLDRAFAAGATDFLSKPFDHVDLPKRLHAAQKLSLDKARQKAQPHMAGDVKGMGDDLKDLRLEDPIALRNVEAAVDYKEFENYLRQVIRSQNAKCTTLAARIADVERLYAAQSETQFERMLVLAAEALEKVVLSEGGVLSYRGSGTFLCIREKRMRLRLISYEVNLNRCFGDLVGNDSAPQLLLGHETPLAQSSEAKALDVLAEAVMSVEERQTGLGDVFSEKLRFMDFPKRFLRRQVSEEARLEKSAYSALLTSMMDESTDDAWRKKLHARDKVVD